MALFLSPDWLSSAPLSQINQTRWGGPSEIGIVVLSCPVTVTPTGSRNAPNRLFLQNTPLPQTVPHPRPLSSSTSLLFLFTSSLPSTPSSSLLCSSRLFFLFPLSPLLLPVPRRNDWTLPSYTRSPRPNTPISLGSQPQPAFNSYFSGYSVTPSTHLPTDAL